MVASDVAVTGRCRSLTRATNGIDPVRHVHWKIL
jgi:hypothetical protein